MYKFLGRKMVKKVLIVVDLFRREFISNLFLKDSLEAQGFKVKITSRLSIGLAFNSFQPHFVIVPKIHKIPELEHIIKHSVVLYSSAESYAGSSRSILDFTAFMQPHLCDYLLCWGEFDRNVYRVQGLFRESQLIVTGNPLIQTWSTRERSTTSSRKRIGIATSLRALTQQNSSKNIIELIANIEETGGQGFYDPPQHAEHRIAFEASWIRVMFMICKELPEYDFIIRAHPIERSELYRYFERFPNVQIDDSQTIEDYTDKIDVLLTLASQAMFDAYRKKKTVISIQNLIPKDIQPFITAALRENFYPFFPTPWNIEELKSLIDQKFAPIVGADHFMEEVYSYPYKTSPSDAIARFIKGLSIEKKFSPLKLKKSSNFFLKIPQSDSVFIFFKDLRFRLLKRGQDVRFTFCAHLLHRNQQAQNKFQNFKSQGQI